ncbi:porin [Serratia marcescens]|uniref:porin n=1 Tax=Serratia TaxID=613 RepID=UPI0021ADE0CA|nr:MULTISPECIES: porin [Serratia]MBN5261552.1 porin [Serratia marcescens]MDM1777248.1 porin [Serratia marcescens]
MIKRNPRYFSAGMLFPLLALLPRGAFAVSLTGSQQNSLNFYGTIIARRYSGHNERDDGDRSYLYFGLIGKKKIAPRWQAYAHWEYTVSFADATRNSTRLAYIGVQNATLGSLDIGRNWGVLYDVTALTDRSPLFREMAYNYIDNFMRGRAHNLLTYRQTFSLFQRRAALALQYQFKDGDDRQAPGKQNGNGFGASFRYALTPTLSLIAAASASQTTQRQQHAAGYRRRIDTLAEGVLYASKKIYLAAVFTQSDNAISPQQTANRGSASSYEALVKYRLTDHIQPNIGYTRLIQARAGRNTDLLNYEELGVTWLLNSNMQVFINYEFNNLSQHAAGVDASDKLDMGISYHW